MAAVRLEIFSDYVAGGRGVVGAQPYEVLEKLVQQAGARRR